MSHKIANLVLALCLLVLNTALASMALAQKKPERARAASVSTIIASEEKVASSTRIDARIVALPGISVTATQTGEAQMAPLRLGQFLEAGALIATLDSSDINNRLDRLALDRRQAAASLPDLREKMRFEQQQLALAEAVKTVRQKRADRADSLAGRQILTQDAVETASLSILDIRQQILRHQQNLASLRQQLILAELELDRIELEIRQLQDDKTKTRIVTPEAGQVIRLPDFSSGFIREGDQLALLRRSVDYEIEADVPAEYLVFLRQTVSVTAFDLEGRSFTARLRAELPEENPRSGTRPVRLQFQEEAEQSLQAAGATVRLDLPTTAPTLHVTIPSDALLPLRGGVIAFIAKDDRAVQRQLKLGGVVGSKVIVLEGISKGEEVIIRGNELLADGDAVRVAGKPGKSGKPSKSGKSGKPEKSGKPAAASGS